MVNNVKKCVCDKVHALKQPTSKNSKNLKTKELLQTLTPKERQLFEKNVIKSHKRISLKKLYQYLKKHDKIEKEVLCPLLFEVTYSTKKDAAIRNELRLLNKEVEHFLAEKEWLKQLSHDPFKVQISLLQVYLDRRQLNLFEQTWKKVYKQAQEERAFEVSIKLTQLFVDYSLAKAENQYDWYLKFNQIILDGLQAIANSAIETYKNLEQKQAFIQRSLLASNPKHNIQLPPTKLHAEVDETTQNYVDYVDCIAKSYLLAGEAKTTKLQQALDSVERILSLKKYAHLKSSIIMIKMSLALEYFLQEKHAEADVLYRKSMTQLDQVHPAARGGILFNYLSNLIFLEAYADAIHCYEQYAHLWEQHPNINYKAKYSLCWAYILSGEYEKPFEILQQYVSKERPENDYTYGKLLLIVTYYVMNDVEIAERELYNFNQNCRYKAPTESAHADFGKLFYRFLQLLHLPEKDKKNAKSQQLHEELQAQKIHTLSSSKLFFRWLKEQTKKN